MRSLFVGMIMLSASMAVVDTAQAQIQRPPGYGSVRAPIGHRQRIQDDLHRPRIISRRSTRTISSSICRQARTRLLEPARSNLTKTP